jgi:hypothetical protein
VKKRTSRIFGLAAWMIFCGGPFAATQSPGPSRLLVYSLEPGEQIVQAESTIAVCAEGVDTVLLLASGKKNQGPFFVFRDGKKRGPFASLEEAMAAAYETRESLCRKKSDCAAYNPGPPPAGAETAVQPAGAAGQKIEFGDKSFGPYLLVISTKVTPDGALAYFTASNRDKAWFGCSDGRLATFGGLPTEFKFSPDGKSAAVLVEGSLSLGEMENMGKLPPDKLQAALESQNQRYLYTIDGKKFGPFKSSFSASSFWFPGVGNDLYFRVGEQVFRNGNPHFKAASLDPCDFYPSPDGRAYALFTYESVVFSDGQTYPYPLDIVVFEDKGKTQFKWISLENNKDLVVYQRSM